MFVSRLRTFAHHHFVALLALFVAMGGTSYAAMKLPAGSVGNKQIRSSAVTSGKVRNGALLAKDFKAGELPAGPAGAAGAAGPAGPAGPQGPAGVVGRLNIHRVDVAVPDDGTLTSDIVACPSNEKFVTGAANLSSNATDVFLTQSRMGDANDAAGGPPADGTTDARLSWVGRAVNPAGGTGAVTLRVVVACTPA